MERKRFRSACGVVIGPEYLLDRGVTRGWRRAMGSVGKGKICKGSRNA